MKSATNIKLDEVFYGLYKKDLGDPISEPLFYYLYVLYEQAIIFNSKINTYSRY